MIRRCTDSDLPVMDAIINEAAEAYRGIIPSDCWHEPYMSPSELASESDGGVKFWGWEEMGTLVGVMGIQQVGDAALIRHAYVRSSRQGHGVGGALLKALVRQATGPLLVGTWAAAEWAIRFYQKHGFRVVSSEEKNRLLSRYWRIPLRQQEISVVLEYVPLPPEPRRNAEQNTNQL